jgi:hypothetical protein
MYLGHGSEPSKLNRFSIHILAPIVIVVVLPCLSNLVEEEEDLIGFSIMCLKDIVNEGIVVLMVSSLFRHTGNYSKLMLLRLLLFRSRIRCSWDNELMIDKTSESFQLHFIMAEENRRAWGWLKGISTLTIIVVVIDIFIEIHGRCKEYIQIFVRVSASR